MILINDISDREKNPFLVTWVNRAGDPLGGGPPPTPPPHLLYMIESRTVAERDNNNILMFTPYPRFLYLSPVLDICYGGLSKPEQKVGNLNR